MHFIFVSECRKKAFNISRSILCKYGIMIGRRSWSCSLTNLSLNEIYEELRKNSSKNTSIHCFRVKSSGNLEFVWKVGNNNSHSSQHQFVISKTKVKKYYSDIKNTNYNILKYLVKISGYFHDLGKINKFFQDKIINGYILSDPYRHELVSVLMLINIYKSFDCKNDIDFFNLFKNKPAIEKTFSIFNNGILFDEHKYLRLLEFILKNGFESNQSPFFSSLLYLIVTHHKSLNGNVNENNISLKINDDPLVHKSGKNKDIFTKKDILNCSTYEVRDDYETPWENDKWKNCVSDIFVILINTDMSAFDITKYYPMLEYYVRYNLVFGDYIISNDENIYSSKKGYYAKPHPKNGKGYGQHITEHTLDVGNKAHYMFRLNFHKLKGIPKSDIPEILKDYTALKGKFKWQDDVCNAIINSPSNIKDSGGFYLMMGDTGSGKSVCIPKLLSVVSDELRYTNLMGLRTLTLQNGKVYGEMIGFTSKQYSTVIGDNTTQRLFDIHNKIDDFKEEMDDNMDIFDMEITQSAYDNPYLNDYEKDGLRVMKRKHKCFFSAPIIVSTIDYYIQAIDMLKNSTSLLRARMYNADTVIDEVDSFDYSDMKAVAKLAYVTGLYGRKLVLSSATISPIIANEFYKAYKAGYNLYCEFFNKPCEIYCGWFNDISNQRVISCNDTEVFAKKHDEYVAEVITHIKEQQPVRKADILKISHCNSVSDAYDIILRKSYDLHEIFNTEVANNKFLSMGLVRFNRIKDARDFAMFLSNAKEHDNYDIKIICYHSNMEILLRDYYEDNMDKILNRKNLDFLKQKDLKTWIKTSKKKNLILIVSSTSIEELGRDHDYDWEMIDPISTGSGKQTAGRCNRHREIIVYKPNVFFFDVPIRYITHTNYPYANPGIQSTTVSKPPIELTTPFFELLVNMENMKQQIDSEWILTIPSEDTAELTFKEHKLLKDTLTNGTYSVNYWYQNPFGMLTKSHFEKENRFRKPLPYAHDVTLIKVSDDDNTWEVLNNKDIVNKKTKSCDIKNRDRFLFNFDVNEKLNEYKKLFKIKDDKTALNILRRMNITLYNLNVEINYDMLLGAYYK